MEDPEINKHGRGWVVVFFGLMAALAFFASLRQGRARSGDITPVALRHPAPDMVLTQLNGGDWSLRDHRGHVVLINLWATWCGPCREETPGLVKLYHEAGPKGLEVVGLSLDVEGREKVQAFVRQFQVPYPIVFPEAMSQMEETVEAVPTTILVDKNGRVAKTYVGAVQRRVFAVDVEDLLAEKDIVP